jgi:hypothetical protein
MKKQDFLNAVRQNGASFRVDNISIDTGNAKVFGKGALRIPKGSFLLEVTLDDIKNVPETPTGFIDRSRLWKVRGLIEDEIEFELDDTPSGRREHYGPHPWKVLTFSFCFIDLVPTGWDTLTTAEWKIRHEQAIKARLPAGANNAPSAASQDSPPAPNGDHASVDVRFDATLREFKLIAFNGGTTLTTKNDFLGESPAGSKLDTFHGEFQGWRFALIQNEKDITVHFWARPEYKSASEEDDRRLFRAFLDAVAFTHGQHARPFLTEHRRDGKLVLDRIHLTSEVARTPHAPFTERLDGNARTGALKWGFFEPLEKAYRFFGSTSKLSSEITHLLYLFREASAPGVPERITLLSLCGLFESLIHVAYDEQITSRTTYDTNTFETARKDAIEAVKVKANQSASPGSYDRIIGILACAAPLRLKDKFEAVLDHIQLGPKERWLGVFDLWSDCRNPLSHRLSDEDESDVSTKEQLLAESKIAGAINCMVLKLMGYSGFVRVSAFEDEYCQI